METSPFHLGIIGMGQNLPQEFLKSLEGGGGPRGLSEKNPL